MKIGILGGTFNPIHYGHLRAAEEVGQHLDLEKVFLIPAASPPHKPDSHLASFSDRLQMVQLAAGNSTLLDVMDLEGRRPGHSYSVETLKEFHRLFGSELDLFFLLGMDAFMEINSWKQYDSLMNYANFVVISRGEYEAENFDSFFNTHFPKGTKCGPSVFQMPSGYSVVIITTTFLDISSTFIRGLVFKNKSIHYLLPGAVEEYILERGLYRSHAIP